MMPSKRKSWWDEAQGFGAKAPRGRLLPQALRCKPFPPLEPQNRVNSAVPRHNEIKDPLAKKILKWLEAE